MKTPVLRNFSFAAVTLCFLLISSCATNPVTGKKDLILLSEDQEIQMGKESDPQIVASFGLYDNQQLQNFIDRKGQEMANISHRSHLNYEFKILDSPVVNAFAVPGGYVYFTRGIMAHFNNEAEFAGVLGHEIGHITARHSAKQYTNQVLAQVGLIAGIIIKPELAQLADVAQSGISLLFLKFSRDNESESDALGVQYSTTVGYDSHEMANFFETIGRLQESGGAEVPNFLSTHPDPAGREKNVHNLTEEWQQKIPKSNYEVGRDSYLSMLEGLVYGEDPRQGFVESGNFYHPELKFQFPVPSGWKTSNSPIQFQMAPDNGKALMVLTLAQEGSLDQAATAAIENNGLQVESRENLNVNGFSAIKLVSTLVNEQDPSANLRVMTYLIKDGSNIYKFHGISLAGDYNSYRNNFSATMGGYKRLTDADKLNRQPARIRLKKVTQSAPLQSVLNSFGVDGAMQEEHAVINGMDLNQQVPSGTTIKIVSK